MKHLLSLGVLMIFTFLFIASSKTSVNYYQVYTVTAEDSKEVSKELQFEDKNCIISYNLWKNLGDIGFSIYNKTDQDLTVNIDKSFFVRNGIAYDYYQNRIVTNTTDVESAVSHRYYPYAFGSSTVASTRSKEGYSVSYAEQPSILVPPKTRRILDEYQIINGYFNSCDLAEFPSKSNIKTLSYTEGNSPYVFSNIITYTINDSVTRVENKFYVSGITNYPGSEITIKQYPDNCGKKSDKAITVFTNTAPNKFYYRYINEEGKKSK